MIKPFKDLNLNSSFLFAAALSDPDTCRIVLEIIFGRKISKVNVKSENSIMLSSDARCVRLDINARDEFNVNYNIEAQNSDEGNIVKRSRYYQAEMDVAELRPGDDFEKLPDSYVIFICTFDPFKRGLYRYTFIEKCEEDGEPLGDGTCKIFFNTKGTNVGDVPEELIHFLKYFEDSTDKYVSTVDDRSIRELHRKISELKKSREWESGYMKMEELLERTKQKGIEIGIDQGIGQGIELGISQGIGQGKQMAILSILADKGELSEDIRETINNEEDVTQLDSWVKLAANVRSVEEFKENM